MNDREPLILMVEDDAELARLNARFLARKGYALRLAGGAAEALALARECAPDLFILDVMLPDGDGFSLCEELRAGNDAPVLFLTGRSTPGDKVTGLEAGADYYLTKPYDRQEFLAVVQSLLRRAKLTKERMAELTTLTRGPLTLQIAQSKAFVNGRDAGLTPKEFAVLLLLAQNEGKELTGEEIYARVWGMTANNDKNAIRMHISRLKKKLGEEGTDGFSILNEYGRGYLFTTR
ncbi:MAG: response regulator transcription factor [Christensenellaceae bacterium]|jgi:DNA-binding response OmpR family regulator|nr:response regulator transcription factor [Christensenellaceae bacterium]